VFANLLLTRKRNIKYTSLLFIINYLIFIFAYYISYTFLKDTNFYQYIPTILGFTFAIFIIIAYKESISIKIFTMFTIRLFSVIILIISSYIMSLFDIKDFNNYKSFSILLRNFIQLLLIPMVYLYFKKRYKETLKFVSNKVIDIITFYSIVIFLFLDNYYQFNVYKNSHSNDIISSLLFIFIIILSYVIIFIAISSINRNIKLEYKLKVIDTGVELQKRNYETLNKSLENYYVFKHDIRHKFLVIKSMMDAGNFTAASEYLNRFNENEINQNIDVLCKNFMVDSILKYYKSIALDNNIEFKVSSNIPEDIKMDNVDLAVVIGNCAENAIEACSKVTEEGSGCIELKTEIIGYQLVIKIKNNFNGQVNKEGNTIKTSKHGQGHGIGLSSVRNITEKYNGYLDIKYDDHEFQVCAVMNIN
jgi:two-component system, LytTR family, sensor histidine kinase AgrC